MVLWLNRSVVQGPRNGTTSHTINFTAATAGNLLVLIMEGAVTHTVPTGWTRQVQALNNSELSIYTKTASSGESSFSTTHNASNYPIAAIVYEFAAGSTWGTSVSATGLSVFAANPNLTGLTGTNFVLGVTASVNPDTTLTESVSWTATPTPTEDFDLSVVKVSTDGYTVSLCYVEAHTGSSFQPTGVVTGGLAKEAITFTIVVASSGNASVSAVVATSSVLAPAPSLKLDANLVGVASTAALAAPAGSVRGNAGVISTVAAVSELALAPTVTTTVTAVAAVATISLTAPAPVVTADQNGDVLITSVAATVSLMAFPPTVTGSSLATAPVSTVSVAAPNPTVGMHVRIDSFVSTISIQALAPSVIAEGDAIVPAVAALVAVDAPAPSLSIDVVLVSVLSTMSIQIPTPSLAVDTVLAAPVVTVGVSSPAPAVSVGSQAVVGAVTALVDVQAHDPILSIGGAVIVEAATAILSLTAIPPSVSANEGEMESEYAYYAALSGLTPKENFSLNDHRRKYWKDQLASALNHIDDLQRAYYPHGPYEGFLVSASGTRVQSLSDLKRVTFNL